MKHIVAALTAALLALGMTAGPALATQTIGSGSTPGEDHTFSTGCYGDCGYDCAWWRCGHTSACVTHDYYTRVYGMFSSAAMSRLGPALVDWGSCWYGRAKQSIGDTIRSGWTGVTDWFSKRLR
ncbi:MAG: hypothetical protein D6689_17635 [Deltaproteobacteria bacterium]|nr:MAG: hypothetical protein D6689_17635 [Deltaproteobacteria bacterium]